MKKANIHILAGAEAVISADLSPAGIGAAADDYLPFLKASIERLEQNDAAGAARAASDALHRAPHVPEAQYAYGQAWTALNDHARAEYAFAAAIKLAPRWIDAWIEYGLARYRRGGIEDAKTAMRQALKIAPGHPAATANLGAFMRISGEGEQAETLLRETVARAPENVGARLNLAVDLLQEERAQEALALLDGEPPADDLRTARHWHLQRAAALLQLRRVAEAQAAMEAFAALGPTPPEVAPLVHWRQLLFALAGNDRPRALQEARLMEASLAAMGPAAVPEHRILAHYDLGRFWAGQGDRARTFRHWTEAHALLKASQPFSRAAHAAFIEANIAAFDRERFADGPRAGNDDPVPVFIVGMPRSGTTLCEQILAAHRDVHGAGERPALNRAFRALGGGENAESARRVAAQDGPALDRAADAYLAELKALAPGKARIIDKMPGNFSYLGLAGLILPGARIIHCMRDPRDIGLSIFTFRFHGYHPYAHDLGDLGFAIAQQLRIMGHWKAALPNPVLSIRLSDWVEDFDATLARVLAHLGLPHDPACARFHENDRRVRTASRAQVRQPVNARGLGRWRAFAAELGPLIAELEPAGALAGWEDDKR